MNIHQWMFGLAGMDIIHKFLMDHILQQLRLCQLVTSDEQFYSSQHFHFSGPSPYYQQQPNLYSPSPNCVISQIDPNPIGPIDATGQGRLLSSDMLFGRDWSKQPDGSSLTMLPSPVASQPIPMHSSFGQTSIPGMEL